MFNKVVLVGNLTRDIELRFLQQGGTAVGRTGIAVNHRFTANGEKREETCFVDITFWGRNAEIANQSLKKGSKILVEGRLKFETWTDQNGQNRSKHSIQVESMEMLDSKNDNSQAQYPKSAPMQQRYEPRADSYQQENLPSVDVDADLKNEVSSRNEVPQGEEEIPF
nr:single-stranded DNA-binding protein [Campylobacter sp.]